MSGVSIVEFEQVNVGKMRVKRYRVGELGVDFFPSTYPAIILLGGTHLLKDIKKTIQQPP